RLGTTDQVWNSPPATSAVLGGLHPQTTGAGFQPRSTGWHPGRNLIAVVHPATGAHVGHHALLRILFNHFGQIRQHWSAEQPKRKQKQPGRKQPLPPPLPPFRTTTVTHCFSTPLSCHVPC